jgi:dynein heavy chain
MANFIKSICELYLTFSQPEWDAQGGAISSFLSASSQPGTALYVWTSSSTEHREVRTTRSREVEETDDEEEEAGEGGAEAGDAAAAEGAPRPRRTRTRLIEESVTERQAVVRTSVHSSVAGFPGEAAGSVAYFVRGSHEGHIGEAQASEGELEFGVLCGGGDLLGSMHGVVRHVFTPLLEPQLQPRSAFEGRDGGGDGQTLGDTHSVASGHGGGAITSSTPRKSTAFGASTVGGQTMDASTMGGNTTQGGGGGGAGAGGAAQARLALPAPEHTHALASGLGDGVRSEFRSSLSRFATVIQHAMQRAAGGGLRLELPPGLPSLADHEAVSQDEALKGELSELVEGWTRLLAGACEPPSEEAKGLLPLTEVECWRMRSASLQQLQEQLGQPHVRDATAILAASGDRVAEVFRAAQGGLAKASSEAQDNVKFLSTLERYFKTLSSGSLASITECLPSLLNGLRMVWTISKGYNSDDTMLPLLRRTASELCDRVAGEVGSLKLLLGGAAADPRGVLALLAGARGVLDTWRRHYSGTRERIEASGSSHRWDFDKRPLLDRAEYMGSVLGEVAHVVGSISQLSTFFSCNELRALSSDPSELEGILASVRRLAGPFARIKFSPWDKARSSKWRSEMRAFDRAVASVELRTQHFISDAFAALRSAEGAFDVLSKLSTMPMRDSLRALLHSNATNIITKARAELGEIRELFLARKDSPPVAKNSPPIAGAIAWANSLYLRQKRPILRIKASLPALFETPEGQALRSEYLAFARGVDAYIKGLYTGWCEATKRSAAELLSAAILGPGLLPAPLAPREVYATVCAAPPPPTAAGSLGGGGGAAMMRAMATAAAAAAVAQAADSSLTAREPLVPRLPPPPYTVNCSPHLFRLVRECKLLDRMGYPLPEVAMAIALAEGTLTGHVASLTGMLEVYHATLSSLTPVEANLLQVHLVRLRIALRPGFSPLNWNSLHIASFTASVHTALTELASALDQLRKSCQMLEELVGAIGDTRLVSVAAVGRQRCLGLGELCGELERYRLETLRGLLGRYASVKPVMLQVESLIAGTSTCASPRLAEFYRYWERRLYNALTSMILQSLVAVSVLFNLCKPPEGMALPPDRPLIRVRAAFNAAVCPPEVQYHPEVAEHGGGVINAVKDVFKSLIDSGRDFKRWMDGTCLPVEVVALAGGEAPPDFSFTRDISLNARVRDAYITPHAPLYNSKISIKELVGNLWGGPTGIGARPPSKIWTPRRPENDKRTLDMRDPPPAAYYCERMSRLSRLAESVGTLPPHTDIFFMRIDCTALASAVKLQALKCKAGEGKMLRDLAFKRLGEVRARMEELRSALDVQPTDLASLKGVLSVVAEIRELRCDILVTIADVQDRYATLAQHGFPGEEAATPSAAAVAAAAAAAASAGGGEGSAGESASAAAAAAAAAPSPPLSPWRAEAAAAAQLASDWQELVDYGLTRSARLVRIKEKFREVTRVDAAAFVVEADGLHKEFQATGPACSSVSLAEGAAAMVHFSGRMEEASRRREAFSAAERLFDLPVTRFVQLGEVKEAMDVVAPLYALYAEKSAFVEGNSAMPWAELDMAALTRGSEELSKKLLKFREVKSHPVYGLLADDISGFKESLPLINSLKNPAMKDRHWDAISTLTSIKIPPVKSLTLGAIFAMNLSRFGEGVEDVCTQAKGELKIEKDLKAIADKWDSSTFAVVPYKKNGEVRGSLLRPEETLRQFLDDDLMNLAAISGSRFVPIFAEEVSKWDKRLNLVSECVDVWLVVQTKWAYLEGIFIGSEDIRQQLPEETKRFAAIHKEFTGVMEAVKKEPKVVDACCAEGRFALLTLLGERLDGCQKSLSEYLYTKRNLFPRFFFISDDELLSVLGSSDPNSIQVHLLKLFDNVKAFGLKTITTPGGAKVAVCEMGSSEGERFETRSPSVAEGPVEAWMTAAESEMKSSLRLITKEGVFKYASTPRTAWIAEVLGMVAVAGSQTWWTWETEDTFLRVRSGDKYAMKAYAERQSRQLMDLVAKVRQPIEKQERIKVNTLLIVDIHARDIIDSFVRDSVLDSKEFAWESQLRFYWDKGLDDIQIRQCTGVLRYGFEYMGLNGRLVITPLTDRCYMTLTQALTFNLGGAPAGPAGTGKTETTKDLAKNLAIPCFVTK